MTYVHSFYGYIPPPRSDGVPWEQVRVEESEVADGPYVAVQTIDLSPLDANPEQPMERNFTISEATLSQGYFQTIFIDGNGSESAPSVPVLLPQLAPTESLGPVGDLVASLLGETYIALRASDNFGDAKVLARIEAAKYNTLPALLAAADESTYPFALQDYIAKRAALELIPAGIEHWMMESITKSATGTNETVSYVDRAKVLQDLAKYLQAELLALQSNPSVVPSLISPSDYPAISEDGALITEDPYEFRPAFRRFPGGHVFITQWSGVDGPDRG